MITLNEFMWQQGIGRRIRVLACATVLAVGVPSAVGAASFVPDVGTGTASVLGNVFLCDPECHTSGERVTADPAFPFAIEAAPGVDGQSRSRAALDGVLASDRIVVQGEAYSPSPAMLSTTANYSLDITLDESATVRWWGSMSGFGSFPLDTIMQLHLEKLKPNGDPGQQIFFFEYSVVDPTANSFDDSGVLQAGRYRLRAQVDLFSQSAPDVERTFALNLKILPEPTTGRLLLAALAFGLLGRDPRRV